MKTYVSYLSLAFVLSLTACIENTGTGNPNINNPLAALTDLSGTYRGTATYERSQRRFHYNGDQSFDSLQTIVMAADTFEETFIVTAIDLPKNIYKVERTGPYQTFFYEIGAKDNDYTFGVDNSYFLDYTYDKYWESYMKIDPLKDSLLGHMKELGIFSTYIEDSLGNILYEFKQDDIYEVRAKR